MEQEQMSDLIVEVFFPPKTEVGDVFIWLWDRNYWPECVCKSTPNDDKSWYVRVSKLKI